MKQKVEPVKNYLLQLQDRIANNLLKTDPQVKLTKDNWSKNLGGGGLTLAFSGENIIEKAGVNFSHVYGESLPQAATLKRPDLTNKPFQAIGISLIIHPVNPFVPTCHANLRFFIAENDHQDTWWFGGGFDLTPYYAFEEDCIHWHQVAKKACDPFGLELYPRFKKWADDYFFLPHRNEARGIGGIFFDDINQWDFETSFGFIRSVGDHFQEAYFPLVDRRKLTPYTDANKNFQLLRRGRYVEFNLIYDRGTLFGLQSGGRVESILISLPSLVSWQYNWQPIPGSAEAELFEKYLIPQNWAEKSL
jgi:coproporphyrinogen III oxidase